MKLYTLSFILLTSLWYCKSYSQTDLNSTIQDYQQEILGIWVLETDSETKMEFLDNGTINHYYGNQLRLSESYEITETCDGETKGNGTYFLKTFSNTNDFFCSYVEGLNFEGSNMMSLMTKDQGKIVVYVRP